MTFPCPQVSTGVETEECPVTPPLEPDKNSVTFSVKPKLITSHEPDSTQLVRPGPGTLKICTCA